MSLGWHVEVPFKEAALLLREDSFCDPNKRSPEEVSLDVLIMCMHALQCWLNLLRHSVQNSLHE